MKLRRHALGSIATVVLGCGCAVQQTEVAPPSSLPEGSSRETRCTERLRRARDELGAQHPSFGGATLEHRSRRIAPSVAGEPDGGFEAEVISLAVDPMAEARYAARVVLYRRPRWARTPSDWLRMRSPAVVPGESVWGALQRRTEDAEVSLEVRSSQPALVERVLATLKNAAEDCMAARPVTRHNDPTP